jgi:hypothetical protein
MEVSYGYAHAYYVSYQIERLTAILHRLICFVRIAIFNEHKLCTIKLLKSRLLPTDLHCFCSNLSPRTNDAHKNRP